MIFFESESKTLEIQTIFHSRDLFFRLLISSKTLEIQTISYFLSKSKIALLAESQKCLFLKTSTFWKSFKNHYTKWCFRFAKPFVSMHFCDWSQKAFVFASGVEAKIILFQKCLFPMVRNHRKSSFLKSDISWNKWDTIHRRAL